MAIAPCLLQPLVESRLSQVMLEATFSPASSTDSLLVLLALQASLDHTGYPPEVMDSEFAFGPISRVQAKLPMF